MATEQVWQVKLTATAEAMLEEIKDKRTVRKIVNDLIKLKNEPDKQGKHLLQELSGYRSLRAAGQRYRIIYRVEVEVVIVYVVAIGLRREESKRDIYALAQKLSQRGLLKPDLEQG